MLHNWVLKVNGLCSSLNCMTFKQVTQKPSFCYLKTEIILLVFKVFVDLKMI